MRVRAAYPQTPNTTPHQTTTTITLKAIPQARAAVAGLAETEADGGAFAATLSQAAALPGGRIPLPKKTYVHVTDRMQAEAAEAPGARIAERAAELAAEDDARQAAEVAGELQELDGFEARMRSLLRARSRAARTARLSDMTLDEGDEGYYD